MECFCRFMQSDPWWSLAMAVNVWMVFFLAANPTSFRQYLWIYCLVCYGAPALPAVVLLLIRDDPKGPVYGNATVSPTPFRRRNKGYGNTVLQQSTCVSRVLTTFSKQLWCWIGDKWSALRIFTYYLPIWVCILLSTIIYFAVGYQVFHQRNQLRNLTLSNPAKETSSSDDRESGEKVSVSISSVSVEPRPVCRTKTLLPTAGALLHLYVLRSTPSFLSHHSQCSPLPAYHPPPCALNHNI